MINIHKSIIKKNINYFKLIILLFKYIKVYSNKINKYGDWGLGLIPNLQSPKNPQPKFFLKYKYLFFFMC